MTRESVAIAAEPLSASFSSLDYSRMEQASKKSAKADMERDVSDARRQLAGGNVREATANFNRAKAKSSTDKEAVDEVKKLEGDLKAAQASNLISAQNAFYFRNSGSLTVGGTSQNQPQTLGLLNDNAAAGEQWTKLQAAQEIVTAKVQPLRVNLPVRGQRMAFAQVLQTEGGKPMTFVLAADNLKMIHWPSRLAAGLAMFACLWLVVAVVSRVTSPRRN
jgi:hypothetical protein